MSSIDDLDTFWSSPDLGQEDGQLSIWLDCGFEEDNRVIGWFDHDYAEGGGIGRVPIRELFEGFSYWQTWIDAAVDAASAIGLRKASYAWMLFDHRYRATPGPIPGTDGGYFIGTVPYQRPDGQHS